MPLSAGASSLIIEHGPRTAQKIALTFDACPSNLQDEYDSPVIDILLQEKVPATLFLSGRWIEKNPEKARFLAGQALFEIANHSYRHPHFPEKSDERIRQELSRTQAVIRRVTGREAHYFRPPYGEVNEHIAQLAAEEGLITIQFDLASGDPDPALSAKAITQAILKNARNGGIIVFHMNRKGVHTAEILPAVIQGLSRKGFTFVTVGELLDQNGTDKNKRVKSTPDVQPKAEVRNVKAVFRLP